MQQTNQNKGSGVRQNNRLQRNSDHYGSTQEKDEGKYPEMHWTTAYIDDKYYIAHPLDLDKLIKLEEQIKMQKNRLKLPEGISQQEKKQDSESIKSHKLKNRPDSSVSRDCKTEINELRDLKKKVEAQKQLILEEQKYKQKLEQFKKSRKHKNQILNEVKQTQKDQKQQQKAEKIQNSKTSKKSNKSSIKGHMVAPHELKGNKSQSQKIPLKNQENPQKSKKSNLDQKKSKKIYNAEKLENQSRKSEKKGNSIKKSQNSSKNQQNQYITFKPTQNEKAQKVQICSNKSSKKSEKKLLNEEENKSGKAFVISSRKNPSQSQGKDRSNLQSASSASSRMQIDELNKKIKQMQSKLDNIEKRQQQLQVIEKSRVQQFQHLSPSNSRAKKDKQEQIKEKSIQQQNVNQLPQKSIGQKKQNLDEKSYSSRKDEIQSVRDEKSLIKDDNKSVSVKRDTIQELIAIKSQRKKLGLSSSIVSYNYTQDLLKMKLDENQATQKQRMNKQIGDLKKTIRQLKLERIKHQAIIEQLEKQNPDKKASRYQHSEDKGSRVSQKVQNDAFRKKTIERVDSNQLLPKKDTRRMLKYDNTKEKAKNFRISKEKTESQNSRVSKKTENPQQNSYRQFQPLSLSRKGIIVRQIFSNSINQDTEQNSFATDYKQLPEKYAGLDQQSPKNSQHKIFQLQFVKQQYKRKDSISSQSEEEVPVPNIDIEPFPIPQIPQPPKSDISQGDLLNLAKSTCQKFGIAVIKDDSLYMKKYKNCLIFKTPDDKKTIVWHYSGKFFIGGWDQNEGGEGKKNGQGFEFIPQKYYYKGQFLQGKKNGSGMQISLNGNIYSGQWVKGEKHGQGTFYEKNLNQYYQGQWKQNKKDGKGILKISQIQFYDGTFVKNIKHGYGYEVFSNGDRYRGEYKNGRFHGKGKYYWSNGSYYDGHFSDGHRDGNGKWKSSKKGGDKYVGQYKKDKKNGTGRYYWQNGCVYEGQFLQDLKHGKGKVYYADGREVKGIWEMGKLVEIDQKIHQIQTQSNKDEPLKKPISGKMVETPSKQIQSSKLLYRI